jgi:flavin reductase (DIM6/NTAB) family NADH-FMN oxidoreductase RutF
MEITRLRDESHSRFLMGRHEGATLTPSKFLQSFSFPPAKTRLVVIQMKNIYLTDIEVMGKLARVQFSNTLPGPKPISLIGTLSRDGQTNLAPFSTVTHLGSNPALIGLVSRPDMVDRHTLSNILETRCYTINHVHSGILDQAHHCSARYPRETSEFTATGLTPHFEPGIAAPFVAESRFRFALDLVETIPITANDTILIVGKVRLVQLPEEHLAADGSVDLTAIGSLASTALDTYFELSQPTRLPYAKAKNTL